MDKAHQQFSHRLKYRFNDDAWLQRALQHRSVGLPNNERLEFVGDAVLGYIIAEVLFQQNANAREGQLSRWRASLVRRETLADIARELQLGECVQLGPGESKSGGHDRDSVLADAFEAVVAAIYFDSGMQSCKSIVLGLYDSRLKRLAQGDETKDSKTQLQEFLQARQLALPSYDVLRVEGEAHAQVFTVTCSVEGLLPPVQAQAGTRRGAEQATARLYLIALKKEYQND